MIKLILNDRAEVHLLRYSSIEVQAIAKSSRLECGMLRVLQLSWALMPRPLCC